MKTGNYDENRLLHLLLDMGEMLLDSGAEIKRVEDTLQRIGCAYGSSQDECVCYYIQYRDNNGKNERRTAYAYQKGKLYGQYRLYCTGTAECPQQELLHESDSDGSVSEKTS